MQLHHIGYVCRDVQKKAGEFCILLNATTKGEPVIDNHQGVKILFIELPDGTLIELLEPWGSNSPVNRHLEKGGGLYHMCFQVDDLERKLADITKDNKAMVVKVPASAPAINNRHVAFVITAQKDLIEFVETTKE